MRLRCLPGAHDAGQRAFIGDRQRAIALAGGTREQLFGDRSTALETEGRQAVQFGVAGQFAVHGGSAEPAVQHPRRMRIVALTEGPSALAVCGFHHVVVAARVGLVPPARFDPLRPGDDAQARVTQRLRGVQQPAGRSGQYDGGLAAGWVPLARSGRWSACTASGCTASSPSRARRRSRSWFQGIACAGRVSNRSRAAGTNGGNCSACRRSAAGRQGESLHAVACDLEQQRGIALGRQQADGQHAGRQQVMLELQVEALHAAIARTQERGQVQQQAAQREQQGLAGFDFVLEFDACIETVRWLVVAQGRGGSPTQCIQLLQHVRCEAPGQAVARQFAPRPACAGRNGQAR